jgi:hypothetical protein
MSYAFKGATSFDKVLFWNTTQVTTMKGMFSGASSFNGDINIFDVSNVVDLSEMVSARRVCALRTNTKMTNFFMLDLPEKILVFRCRKFQW